MPPTPSVTPMVEAPPLLDRPARLDASPRLPGRGWLTRDRAIVLALVVAGLTLRVLADRSLWLDEAISARQAQLPFIEMLRDLRFSDVHPPLHHTLLWVVTRAFGTSELALRLPSIAAGVGLIPMLYLTGRIAYDRRAGLAAAALGTVAPLAVWYSHEARAYALYMLFALAALYAQLAVFRRGRPWAWVLYTGATIALVWTHYFGTLQVAVQLVAFVVVAWRRHRAGERVLKPLLLPLTAVVLVIAAALTPLAPFAFDQLQTNRLRAAGELPAQAGGGVSGLAGKPTVYAIGANLAWAVWGFHSDQTMAQLVALWPLAMLLALVLLGRGRSTATSLTLAAVLVPVLALFALGFRSRIAFEVRQFASVVPLLMLLVARLVTAVPRRRGAAAIATVVTLATLVVGLADQQFNQRNPRVHDVEGAIAETVRRADADDVLVYAPPFLEDIVRYYGDEVGQVQPPSVPVPDDPGTRVFLLGGFLDDPRHSAAIGNVLARLEEDRRVVDVFERPQVRVWVLEPAEASSAAPPS